jgi:glycosyltransferase involved in cell wall biosynthesis
MTQSAVVIPCLNEAAGIGEVVKAVKGLVQTVFVVDDGSSDGTAMMAKNAGAEVVRHVSPRGKGAALQTGWALARKRGFRWALAMDGDGQHLASDIPKFFESAERTGATLIVGNRMGKPEGMPRVRRFVNGWMSRRISSLAGMPLPDSQCGFRLMNLEAWAAQRISAAHFEIESDVLLAFARSGGPVAFVPIEVVYKGEQSKIHPVRDTLRWVGWWWRVRPGSAERYVFENVQPTLGLENKFGSLTQRKPLRGQPWAE